jgi:ribosomal protein L40E
MVFGEPDADWLRANQPTARQEEALRLNQRETNIDNALDNLQFSKKRCAACGYPVPSWWEACRVCGSTELRAAATSIP